MRVKTITKTMSTTPFKYLKTGAVFRIHSESRIYMKLSSDYSAALNGEIAHISDETQVILVEGYFQEEASNE